MLKNFSKRVSNFLSNRSENVPVGNAYLCVVVCVCVCMCVVFRGWGRLCGKAKVVNYYHLGIWMKNIWNLCVLFFQLSIKLCPKKKVKREKNLMYFIGCNKKIA